MVFHGCCINASLALIFVNRRVLSVYALCAPHNITPRNRMFLTKHQAFVDMLRDSISGTDVAFKSISANYEEYALPAEYSMSHSAVQYALLCSKL